MELENKLYEKQKVLDSIDNLYKDIDNCMTRLLKGRVNKNDDMEGRALFEMEGLMVSTQQELSCLRDYIETTK